MRAIRTATAALGATALAVALAGCGADEDPLAGGGSEGGSITVGSANFPEAVLLGEIYAQALEAQDVEVQRNLNIGAREIYIRAIEDGSISLLPEYTGNLLLYYDKSSRETDPDNVYQDLQQALPEELTVLEMSEAVDQDELVVTQETADKYDLESIADLAPVADQLVVGGSSEFRTRQAGLPGLEDVYGLEFADFKTLDVAGPLTVEALTSGEVDVARLFSTQSVIETEDFVVLDDPKNVSIPQNVTPLIRTEAVTDEIESTLNGVSEALTTQVLADMVARLEVDKDSPEQVAEDFLAENDLAG